MWRQTDLNQTNVTDRASSRSSSKRKLSIVSRPSLRKLEETLEQKGILDGLLGCRNGRIASEKHIESVIDLSVKQQLESRRPSVAFSMRSILTDP